MAEDELAIARTLPELEAVVERGLNLFMEVGEALTEIRDRHLYQERGYTRFEDYCQEFFGISRIRAYQFIEAAQTIEAMDEVLTTVNTPPPSTERQVRELVPLAREDPAAATEVWDDVYHATDGHPTAAAVREAVRERRPAGPSPAPKPTANPPRMAVIDFGHVVEFAPEAMARAIPDDQAGWRLEEATAAHHWLGKYIRELRGRVAALAAPEGDPNWQ